MRPLELGGWQSLSGRESGDLRLPAHHLLTHSVAVGMTGSGKTGLLFVLVEEALRSGVPVLMIDLKGDLPNLALSFDTPGPEPFLPWAASMLGPNDPRTAEQLAADLAALRQRGFDSWNITHQDLAHYNASTQIRVLTPGSSAGEQVHLLSALERPSRRWNEGSDGDDSGVSNGAREAAQQSLSAAISLLLNLVGRDADPVRSREHVLLSLLAQRRLSSGQPAEIGALIHDLLEPPLSEIGALSVEGYISTAQRGALAAALNSLLVAPSFETWRTGTDLDVGAWLTPTNSRTPGIVFSVAHLEEEERRLVLGLLLDEVLSWVRTLTGTQRLRALVVIDEVFGLLPPHPANPPTKGPIVSLMKQARAYGVGMVLATQNPMDLDYRALSNAGLWCIGRLQTDADRERVLEGLSLNSAASTDPKQLHQVVKQLAKRYFVLRDAHDTEAGLRLLQPRWAYSFMRGPMTRSEIARAVKRRV